MEGGERKEEWKRAEIEILCCRLEGQRIPGNRAIQKNFNSQKCFFLYSRIILNFFHNLNILKNCYRIIIFNLHLHLDTFYISYFRLTLFYILSFFL